MARNTYQLSTAERGPRRDLAQHFAGLFGDLQFEDDAPAVMAIPGKQALLNKFVLFKSTDCAWLW